jgi:hypothetical protein
MGRRGWLGWVVGGTDVTDGDAFPEAELRRALATLEGRLAEMRADPTSPNSRLSDDMNHINPVSEARAASQPPAARADSIAASVLAC